MNTNKPVEKHPYEPPELLDIKPVTICRGDTDKPSDDGADDEW